MIEERFIRVGGAASLWVMAYVLNHLLFAHTEWSDVAHWIFLPAAVRVLVVLLWSTEGAIGLGLGTLVTNLRVGDMSLEASLAVALVSAAAPWLALSWLRQHRLVGRSLKHLSLGRLALVVACCAGVNALLHGLLFHSLGRPEPLLSLLSVMAFGDLLGAFVLLAALRQWQRRAGV